MKTISEHLYKNSFLLSIVRFEATKQSTTESLESKYNTPKEAESKVRERIHIESVNMTDAPNGDNFLDLVNFFRNIK